MKKVRSSLISLLFLLAGSLLVIVLLNTFIKPPEEEQTLPEDVTHSIELVAIGDSLTEGVGDSLSSGGYVSRIAELLEEKEEIADVTTQNFGVSGNRSDQVLSRMETMPEIKTAVESSDVVTFSVGGNDVIRIFKNELLNVQLDSFKQPLQAYQENLTKMIQLVREWNPKAAIYIFGIYNPYAIYFSEIEEMQRIVDEWNQATQNIATEFSDTYYVPIDSAFAVKDTNNLAQTKETNEVINNPYLYEEDLFHPNDAGYSRMAALLLKEMEKAEDFLD
ncbi:SGNH/GDSL hydrolase family protein [Desemzia sp. RIT804]|uniref:SGNH/GDSL hydrolase family protein n=1 Tax=Desemzia sp. RIT 804 TaxID=2810209 RepID=UPI0019513E42|nr:SGNH/GDSL hydrolase family protein [Desemzia sp. RIT 804]MBM6613750.1 SGNH/GDSL hydrolase family protein [Desemzia sp. RIT 804]